MNLLTAIGRWFKAHEKIVLTHTLILCGFLLFILFIAVPLFDTFERLPGEAQLKQLRLPVETNNVRYSFDNFSIYDQLYLDIQGWAFIEEKDTKNSEIYIVLKSADRLFIFSAETTMRTDVTQYFKESNLNLDYSGLMARIPIRKISASQYTVGLYIKKDSIEALQYTKRVILKSGSTVQVMKLCLD